MNKKVSHRSLSATQALRREFIPFAEVIDEAKMEHLLKSQVRPRDTPLMIQVHLTILSEIDLLRNQNIRRPGIRNWMSLPTLEEEEMACRSRRSTPYQKVVKVATLALVHQQGDSMDTIVLLAGVELHGQCRA
jgi:hypothetical protein